MEGNLVAGANIAGFLKVAEAMKAHGVVWFKNTKALEIFSSAFFMDCLFMKEGDRNTAGSHMGADGAADNVDWQTVDIFLPVICMIGNIFLQ